MTLSGFHFPNQRLQKELHSLILMQLLRFLSLIFSNYYVLLLENLSLPNPFGRLNVEDVAKLLKPVSIGENECALKIDNPHKAQDPNGFNAHFFKFCWPIIGEEVSSAIMEFFHAIFVESVESYIYCASTDRRQFIEVVVKVVPTNLSYIEVTWANLWKRRIFTRKSILNM